MNGAHWHLLVNHVPVFTVAFGTLGLVWCLLRPTREMFWATVALFVGGGIFSFVASETGEAAEGILKAFPEVSHALIHAHEEAADWALASALVAAVLALALLVVERMKPNLLRRSKIVLLVAALITNAVMARTAYLGGLIRHSEIR